MNISRLLPLLLCSGLLCAGPVYIKEKTDSFTGNTSYTSETFNTITKKLEDTPFSLTLNVSGAKYPNRIPPSILVYYRGSEWFFLHTMDVKTADGKIFRLEGKVLHREAMLGSVDELVAFSPSIPELVAIATSTTLTNRFTGDKGEQVSNVDFNFILACRQFLTLMMTGKMPE